MPYTYIEEVVAKKNPVIVYVLNGFQMRGIIIAEEADSIVLKCKDKNRMIFKQAISTIEAE